MSRFARPEVVPGAVRVVRVWDEAHAVHRAQRLVDRPDPELAVRIRKVARIRHSGLATLVAISDDEGVRIVTEWLPGGPVRGLTPVEALAALEVAASGLEALHAAGLAHGGHLQLLFDATGQPKLYRAGLVPGKPADDLHAFGELVEETAGPVLLPPLQQLSWQAREGGFLDARALLAGLADVRAAVNAVTAAPIVRARRTDADERMRLGWVLVPLVTSFLLVVGAAGLGWWMGMRPQSPPALVPIAAPLPTPRAAVPQPVADPVPAPVPAPPTRRASVSEPVTEEPPIVPIEIVALPPPEPTPPVVTIEVVAPSPAPAPIAPPVLPAPVPPPQVLPLPEPSGGWRVRTDVGTPHPVVTVTLDAANLVADRLGRGGRPRLEIRCADRKLSLALAPGVTAVELVHNTTNDVGYETAPVVSNLRGGDTEDLKLRQYPDDPRLYFPQVQRWVSILRRARGVDLSYTPFASDAVVAGFEVDGLDAALPEIRKYCRVD